MLSMISDSDSGTSPHPGVARMRIMIWTHLDLIQEMDCAPRNLIDAISQIDRGVILSL